MAAPTQDRPCVVNEALAETLSEFLAFRHLFRGASIVLMRWNKLAPLVAKMDQTYREVEGQLNAFCEFLSAQERPRS
jgi:hypothetical protein